MKAVLAIEAGCAQLSTAITPNDKMNGMDAKKDILEHGKFEPNTGAIPIEWISIQKR
jgi:hypothetical protein